MNLSSKVIVNSGGSGGETLTVTCYTCGMPSSKEWAQKTRSRPSSPTRPFFPFLLQMIPPHGAILTEDGSTYLCAFCHASLESQWNNYEVQPNPLPPGSRKYFIHKFICAVCSVETYRKRVRALPFQEFPFLVNKRQPGSLTLGNNPLAVVCLDCSETLWAQSAEYDRWGLPIHKRHFNWMARPPPPEDSVEATVARLPSGETQLPRCPPTEPLIPSKYSQPLSQPEPIAPVKGKPKGNKPDIPQVCNSSRNLRRSPVGSEQPSTSSGRKLSITTTASPLIDAMSTAPSQPPVVTVAPMSSYNTLSSIRKESMSVPPNLTSAYPKYDGIPQPCGMQPSLGPPPLYPRSTLFPSQSPNFPTFSWPGRGDSSYGEAYPYSSIPNTAESLTPQSSSWSWLQSPSPDLLRYQSFMSSFQNRGYGDIYLNHSQPMYGSSSPPSHSSGGPGPSSTPYLSPYRLQTSPTAPQYTNTVSVASSSMQSSVPSIKVSTSSSPYDTMQSMVPVPANSDSVSDESSLYPATVASNNNDEISQGEEIAKNVIEVAVSKKSIASRSSKGASSSSSSASADPVSKVSSPPKKNYSAKKGPSNESGSKPGRSSSPSNGSSRTTPYCKTEERERERTIISSATMKDKSEGYVGKKWQWQSHVRNNNTTNTIKETEEAEPIDCSLKVADENQGSSNSVEMDCAMDLSVSAVKTVLSKEGESVKDETTAGGSYGGSSNKFMIAYLCKSETISPSLDTNEDAMDKYADVASLDMSKEKESPSGRSSVIVSAAKSEGSCDSFMITSVHNSDAPEYCNEAKEKENEEENSTLNHGSTNFAGILQKSESEEISNAIFPPNDAPCASNDSNTTHSCYSEVKDNTPKDVSEQVHERDVAESENIFGKKLEVEKCLQESIAEFMQKKKEEQKTLATKEKEQTSFLAELGLITPEQKTEIELKILISRCDHKTLPPLKMRAESPPKVRLREEFEQQLLQIAFDDPSLKQNTHDPSKSMFLGTLGLKQASKSEKNRRESEWRLVLTERIMREKRDGRLRGTKRPWDSYSDISNLLIPLSKSSRNSPTVLESLSLTMPLVVNTSTGCHTGSSDLLTTVDNREIEKDSNTSNVIKNGMSIVYPKYIPSYVQSSIIGKSEGEDKEEYKEYKEYKGRISSILNVPIISTSSLQSLPNRNNTKPEQSILSDQNDCKESQPISNQSLLVSCGNILKVPVVTPGLVGNSSVSRRGSFTSCHTDDTDDLSSSDETDELNLEPSIVKVDSDEVDENGQVDSIKKSCTDNWRKTQEDIEILVASSSGIENSKYKLTQAAQNLKRLRKCLKSHQIQVKTTEKMLKIKEKQIFKQLRTLGKSKITHVQRNMSKESGKE